jgi:hypothetical protein
MRPASILVGLSIVALGFAGTAAYAAGGQVDGSISVAGSTCSWTNATTRTCTGGPYTATRTSGSFLCPSTESVDSVTLTFH